MLILGKAWNTTFCICFILSFVENDRRGVKNNLVIFITMAQAVHEEVQNLAHANYPANIATLSY